MLWESLIIIFGGLLIVLLADIIVKKTISLAEHWGLSGTFIGMTILSIGTSLPEILTALAGSYQIIKEPKIWETVSSLVVGGNVGSDIFQQNFILGIVALIGAVILLKKELWSTVGGLIGGSLILFFLSLNGLISRGEGIAMVLIYLGYLAYLKRAGLNDKIKPKNQLSKKEVLLALFLLLVSFVIMAFSANEVLKAARVLVDLLPVSASFFGIIILGVVSALPELSTALVALKRKNKGMSVGVLVGSNITNPLFALGLGAIISTYIVPKVIIWYDLPFKIITALLIFWFLWKNKKLNKKQAVVLISLFLLYLIIRNLFFPVDF